MRKKVVDEYEDKNVYIHDNDKYLLKWSIITYALNNKFYIDIFKYNVKRPDGGEYAAFATVDNEYVSSIDYWLLWKYESNI